MMNASRRALVVCLLATLVIPLTSRAAEKDAKPPAREHFKIVLLIGQSNMAGRGKVEPEDKQPHPRVLMLDKSDHWLPAVDPLHFDKPQVVGVGPGSAFGRALADAQPGDSVGLVPCAVGGTSIAQWKPGDKLYAEAVRRAKLALKDGTLAAILWHQGEADSAPDKVAIYPKKAAELFAALRKDLDAPEVPIVIGTLGEFRANHASDLFNAMARKLPDTIPHCAVADAHGLTDKGDHLHFNAESARELGRRYYKAWLSLQKETK